MVGIRGEQQHKFCMWEICKYVNNCGKRVECGGLKWVTVFFLVFFLPPLLNLGRLSDCFEQ